MNDRALKGLWVAFIALIAIIVAQNLLIIYTAQQGAPTQGAAALERTANISVCINRHPYWNNNITCQDAYTGTPYSCNVSAVDPEGHAIARYNASIIAGAPSGARLFENITGGLLSFTATTNETGNYTVRLWATDNQSCALSGTTLFNLTVLQNNNSPYLVRPIPDSEWAQDTILIPYNLNTYFADPDGDPLEYRVQGNAQIRITISEAGEVTLDPEPGFCGEEYVTYTASDPTNLSATSNLVKLKVECDPESQGGDDEQSSSGGGGGGGGGGLGSTHRCIEDYYCYEWSECQYTKAVTSTGDSYSINITGVLGTKTYLVDGELTDEQLLYQGYRWRECIDTNNCEARSKYYVRSCEYAPNCFDHIQNQNEEAVDCGGVCAPCGTCTDGIQNGFETAIDCGGPDCTPCDTCEDGILNGQELSVDCGGPDCPACATCFDGIQNQGETGVDCGGPCQECAQVNVPAPAPVTYALLILVGVLLALVLALVIFRRQISALVSRLLLKYQKTDRVILISREDREELLNKLRRIEDTLESTKPLKRQAVIGELVRDYLHRSLGTPQEASQEQVLAALQGQNVHPQLIAVLSQLFARTTQVEFSEHGVHTTILHTLIAETRTTIHETSAYSAQDLREIREAAAPQERPSDDDSGKLYALAENAYQHIQAGRLLSAEGAYRLASNLYSGLSEDRQRQVYPDIQRLHAHLQFSISYSKSLLARLQKRSEEDA